jgi:hypothetical protein
MVAHEAGTGAQGEGVGGERRRRDGVHGRRGAGDARS